MNSTQFMNEASGVSIIGT